MAVESDTDRAQFFDTDEFGVAARISGAAAGGGTVNGILADDYDEALAVGGGRLTFSCRTVDVSSVVHGTSIVISGTTYKVAGPPQPDGTGVTVLVLEEQ